MQSVRLLTRKGTAPGPWARWSGVGSLPDGVTTWDDLRDFIEHVHPAGGARSVEHETVRVVRLVGGLFAEVRGAVLVTERCKGGRLAASLRVERPAGEGLPELFGAVQSRGAIALALFDDAELARATICDDARGASPGKGAAPDDADAFVARLASLSTAQFLETALPRTEVRDCARAHWPISDPRHPELLARALAALVRLAGDTNRILAAARGDDSAFGDCCVALAPRWFPVEVKVEGCSRADRSLDGTSLLRLCLDERVGAQVLHPVIRRAVVDVRAQRV